MQYPFNTPSLKGSITHVRVLLPSNYLTPGKRYPVLYRYHGGEARVSPPGQRREWPGLSAGPFSSILAKSGALLAWCSGESVTRLWRQVVRERCLAVDYEQESNVLLKSFVT